MSTLQKMSIMLLFLSFTLFAFSIAMGGTFEDKEYDIGIGTGVWLSGNAYVSLLDEDIEKEDTFFLRSFIDYYLIPELAIGGYINYSDVEFKESKSISFVGSDKVYEIPESGVSMIEFGATIKPRFILSPRMAVKPGFNVGQRRFISDSDFMESKGLGLNGSCEIQYLFSERMTFFGEIGFLMQPWGGNEDTDITFSPIFYLTLGAAL